MLSTRSLFALLCFRLFNSVLPRQLFVRGYFTADEYWQSLEVAHNWVWGYGYLTWEWRVSAIRSICYPAVFAVLYWVMKVTGMDYPWAVAYAPRLLCGVFMWLSDICLHRLSEHLSGPVFAKRVLLLYLLNWFLFYSGIRSYGNSLEMVVNVIALLCWVKNHFWGWNLAVAVGSLMRPTAAVMWLPCYLKVATQGKRFCAISLTVVLFLGFQILVDSMYYGQLTLTAYSFLRVNLLEGLAENYGTHPWYWYLTIGAGVPLFTYVPLVLLGIYILSKSHIDTAKLFLPMVAISLLILSLSAHKEYRFLLPIMPLLVITSAYSFDAFHPKTATFLLYSAILLQVPVAVYTSQWHQSGSLATVDFLRENGATSVDFWLDCHLTPYHSHFHNREIQLSFLDCSPLCGVNSEKETEVARFFTHPEREASDRLERLKPEFVVLWSPLRNPLEAILNAKGYTLRETFFHSHFTESPLGDQWNVSFLVFQR